MSQPEIRKAQVSSDIPVKRNIIVNGKFNIWQRGTSAIGIGSGGVYVADRWRDFRFGTATWNVSRSTDVPTFAQSGIAFDFSHKITVVTPDVSLTVGDSYSVDQGLEGQDFISIWQRPLVLSFWVKHHIAGIHCCYSRNAYPSSVPDRSVVMEYTINLANTWEYKEIIVPASPFANGIDNAAVPAAGTWRTDHGRAFDIGFALASASPFIPTPGTWQTGNFIATSNQINGVGTAGDFLITGVQVEVGDIATPFELRPVSEELILCQRYYEKSYNVDTDPGTITTNGLEHVYTNSGGAVSFNVRMKVNKRLNPTITAYSHITGTINRFNNNSVTDVVFPGLSSNGDTGFHTAGIGGFVAGSTNYIQWTSDAEL